MNTVICNNCKATNSANNKFCSNCGVTLKPATHISCPKCYHRNPIQLVFCDNCGQRLVKESPLDKASEQAKPKTNVPQGFSLPSRNPGETAQLDPNKLPDWLKTGENPTNATLTDADLGLVLNQLRDDAPPAGNDHFGQLPEMGDISLTWMGERPAELQEALSSLNPPAAEEPVDPFDLSAFEEDEPVADPSSDKNDFDTLFNQLSYSHEDTPAEKHTMSGNPEYDWLSALSDSGELPAAEEDDEDEPAAFNSSGTGFTGWLNEATLEGAEDHKQSKTMNELFGPSASLEMSDFTEEEPEEEAEDVGGSGFTGWLSQDLPDEFADIEDMPSEQAGFTGWLNAEDAPEEPEEDESPASTGFTSWLSAPDPVARPDATDELPDWLDEPTPPARAEADNFTNWVQQVSSDSADEKDNSGFTDWLNEAATGSFDSSILQPERVETDEKAPPPERGFTDWLAEDDDHFPPAAAQPAGESDEEIPAWLQPFDNPQQSQTATSTGFTDFLENSPAADSLPATSDGSQRLDAPHTDEIPAWLDVPMEEEEPSADVPPLGVGTGFTGWLDESKVPSLPPITPPAASSEELPDWLAQAEPAIPTAEGDSRGLTDWLAENHGHPEEDDDDDDELMPDAQLLMKPLSAEEAQKILAETPPVSDNFITEVVEEDFPDWLTDVKTSEDISDTETIPGWIRAPLTDSDRLTLSLHGENYVEDDWLADVPDESQQSRPYRGTGWLTSLGTLHEENFSWVKPDEEMPKAAAPQPAADEWEIDEEEEELDISQITENDRDQAGLSWMFGTEESGEAAGDDWLSGFGAELPAEPAVASEDDEVDWLTSAPSQAGQPAAGDDWLSGFGEELPAEPAVASADDEVDWLTSAPSQPGQPTAGDDWLSGFGEELPAEPAVASADDEVDWLTSAPSQAGQPAAGDDWLSGFGEELPAEPAVASEDDEVDWLTSAPSQAGQPAAGDDWLSGFGEELPAEPAVASEDNEVDWLTSAPSQPGQPAAGDDWLSGFGEELPAEPAVASADESDDWLTSVPSQAGQPAAANLDNDDWLGEMPSATSSSSAEANWLDDLTPPTSPAENATWMEEMIGEDSGLEELDWLDQPTLAKPTPKVNLTPTPDEPEEEPALPLDPALDYDNLEMGWQEEAQEGEAFDWLSALEGVDLTSLPAEPALGMELPEEGLGAEDNEEELIDFDQIESLNPEELVISNPTFAMMDAGELGLLSELQHLRETEESTPEEELALEEELLEFETPAAPAWVEDIGGDETDFRQVVQTSGPLVGLRGVVAIAPLLVQPAVAPALAPSAIKEIALKSTEEQVQQAQLLKQITAGVLPQVEEEDTVSRSRFEQLIRIFLAILLILAVLGGLFLPAGTLPITSPAAGPALVNFNQTITSFSGQKLLVAIDYTPAVGGELDPMALMVLNQLQAQNNQLVVMSQFPTGWGQAQQLLASTNLTGTTALGYIPGRTVGLRELATCLTQTTGCLNLNPEVLRDVQAVIVFTNERDSLLDWLEQVQPEIQKKGQPLLVGTTEGLAPMAQPYVESQQIRGLIAGTPELATYETQFLGQAGPAYHLLTGRVLAQLLALVVLVVGAVIHALPNRQTPK